jgi:3-oxoacyl-[acyl-carrier-protein] synthase III
MEQTAMNRSILPLDIVGTSTVLPGNCVSTEDIVARLYPRWEAGHILHKTGIRTRHFKHPEDDCASLGTQALSAALSAAGLPAEALSRLIFVSSGAGDLVFPATANLICAGLGLRSTCDCFDLNNACLGFLTALDIAAKDLYFGAGPIGIVVAALGSRCIDASLPRSYLVFGDAVAAVVVRQTETGGGLLGSWLRNDGVAFGNVRLANPAVTGTREFIDFTATNATIADEAITAIRTSADQVLSRAGLRLEDVQWVLPHQPNGALFKAIIEALGIPLERTVPVADSIGSTGAAAIPISLDRLLRERDVRPGDHILLAGVGGGISYGAMLYQVPAR